MIRQNIKPLNIKLIAVDVDGTLTDGRVMIDSNGIESKTFNIKDGMGIRLALEKGMNVIWISGRKSLVSEIRAKELGVALYQPVHDKLALLKSLLYEFKVNPCEVAFIGDDINDIEISRYSGVSFAVADAHESLKKIAKYNLQSPGGGGAIREAIDLILDWM